MSNPSALIEPEPAHPEAARLAAQIKPDDLPPGDWPARGSVPVSVLIPVKNEQDNIVECMRHLLWASQIVVVDSHSSDLTVPLAQAMGGTVYEFTLPEAGWPKKKNWGIATLPWQNEWLLIMDADEHMTPELTREIVEVVEGRYPPGNGSGDGYWLNRRFMFMNSWLKHSGYYPSWNTRLFKHSVGRYERIGELGDTESGDHEIHEHVVLSTGEAGYLKNDFYHYAYPDVTTLVKKHNAYATWEAHAMTMGYEGGFKPSLLGGPIARRRWLRIRSRRMPFRPTLRFLFSYICQGGFLDGRAGYYMCRFLSWYEFISIAKYRELKLPGRRTPPPTDRSVVLPDTRRYAPAQGEVSAQYELPKTLDPAALAARTISPWSFQQKVGRALWYVVQATLFRYSPRTFYRWRNFLLRIFGARVHPTARIRSTAVIEVPWHLSIGAYTVIGEQAILYCLGPVHIGNRVLISQYTHLCAGTHDFTRVDMPLLRPPIVINDDAWVAADAFVGPGVTIGEGAILGARSSAFKDLPAWKVCVGSPAHATADRQFR